MFEGLLNLIFPKFCLNCSRVGSYLCASCSQLVKIYTSNFCPECGRAAIGGATHPLCRQKYCLDGVTCLFEYQDPLKKLIHALKYRFSYDLVKTVEPLLEKTNLPDSLKSYTLIALPLEKRRQNWRGFNQAQLLTNLFVERFNLQVKKDLLERTRFTRQQTGLNLREREKNLAGAFQVPKGVSVKELDLIVFDDVWTTGTTMREAAKVLKKFGARKVWGLCLATSHRVN